MWIMKHRNGLSRNCCLAKRCFGPGARGKGWLFDARTSSRSRSAFFCGGFAIFWEYNAYTSGAPVFALMLGSILVLIGLYLIFGRFIMGIPVRRNSYYGITKERVLIVSRFPAITTKSLGISTLTDMTMTNNSGQSGSISFGPRQPAAGWLNEHHWPGTGAHHAPSFDTIEMSIRSMRSF